MMDTALCNIVEFVGNKVKENCVGPRLNNIVAHLYEVMCHIEKKDNTIVSDYFVVLSELAEEYDNVATQKGYRSAVLSRLIDCLVVSYASSDSSTQFVELAKTVKTFCYVVNGYYLSVRMIKKMYKTRLPIHIQVN